LISQDGKKGTLISRNGQTVVSQSFYSEYVREGVPFRLMDMAGATIPRPGRKGDSTLANFADSLDNGPIFVGDLDMRVLLMFDQLGQGSSGSNVPFGFLRLRYLGRPADVGSLNGWTTAFSVDPAWNVVLLGVLEHVQAHDDGTLPAFVNTKIGRGGNHREIPM